jgi:S1-C subfamily serine protease
MRHLITLTLSLFTSMAYANPYLAESGIFRVEVPYTNSNKMGLGTGVLVAPGKILTNCHVVKDKPGWPRVVHRQTGETFRVSQYITLGGLDACLLLGSFAGTSVRLANGFQEGENVWIFGFPQTVPVVGQGAVKGLVDVDGGGSLLLSAFCAPGSSGGPVINAKGELVGLNWGVYKYQNNCLAIPASALQPYLSGR